MNDWKELEQVDLSKPTENQVLWEELAITAGIGAIVGSVLNFLGAPYLVMPFLRNRNNLEAVQTITDRWWDSGATLFLILVTYPLIYIITETYRLPGWAAILFGALTGTGTIAFMYLVSPQENVLSQDYVLQAILCGFAGYLFCSMRKQSQGTIG